MSCGIVRILSPLCCPDRAEMYPVRVDELYVTLMTYSTLDCVSAMYPTTSGCLPTLGAISVPLRSSSLALIGFSLGLGSVYDERPARIPADSAAGMLSISLLSQNFVSSLAASSVFSSSVIAPIVSVLCVQFFVLREGYTTLFTGK